MVDQMCMESSTERALSLTVETRGRQAREDKGNRGHVEKSIKAIKTTLVWRCGE